MKFINVCSFIVLSFLQENYGSSITTKLQKEYGITGPITFLNYDTKAVNCTGITGAICGDTADDCKYAYLCLPNTPPIVTTCPNGQTCNAGKCVDKPTALCEYGGLEFKCNSEGMFPEPSSCKEYNYCVFPDIFPAYKRICPKGWSYNTANTLCDKPLPEDNICPANERAVPTCEIVGQNAALTASDSYYYICLPHPDNTERIYPAIYRCEGNKKYVGNYMCGSPGI